MKINFSFYKIDLTFIPKGVQNVVLML